MKENDLNALTAAIIAFISENCGIESSPKSSLKDLGLESVMLIELALFLEKTIGRSVSIKDLLEYSNLELASLSAKLC